MIAHTIILIIIFTNIMFINNIDKHPGYLDAITWTEGKLILKSNNPNPERKPKGRAFIF